MRDALRHLAGGTPTPAGRLDALTLHPPLAARIARLDGEREPIARPEG